jgi:hypothetical protein
VIGGFLASLLADLWPYIMGAGAIVAGIWGLRRDAVKDERQQTALQAAEAYAKTRKEIDDADAAMGDDPATLRQWLRDRDPGTR